ncbi:MAG: phosphatidylcholine/phosphatidylserine synthase [Pseudomonadales bacterium]
MNRPVILAWMAHLYTALGLVCALLALLALFDGRPLDVFLWLAVAFVIDATDGILARATRVDVHTPGFSGRKLDDIIDYLNYTFVPVCFIYQMGLLPESWLPLLGCTLIASAYGFCSEAAKTSDGFFTGFPSYWNVVAFYLYFLEPSAAVAVTIVAALTLMTFWPVRYLYPTGNREGRLVGLGGGIVWGAVCFWLIRQHEPPVAWVYASLIYPAWYMGFSFYLHFTRPRPA